jgi:hypothetical protein
MFGQQMTGPKADRRAKRERDFIKEESAKITHQWQAALRKVKRSAENDTALKMSREWNETLTINGLIEFGPPSATNRYNHYRLTEVGEYYLQHGEMP